MSKIFKKQKKNSFSQTWPSSRLCRRHRMVRSPVPVGECFYRWRGSLFRFKRDLLFVEKDVYLFYEIDGYFFIKAIKGLPLSFLIVKLPFMKLWRLDSGLWRYLLKCLTLMLLLILFSLFLLLLLIDVQVVILLLLMLMLLIILLLGSMLRRRKEEKFCSVQLS